MSLPRVQQSHSSRAPLTHSQRSFWLLHQLDPTRCAYNIPLVFRVRGHLDTEALGRAFDVVVAAHPSLHTQFDHEEPIQCVRPEWRMRLETLDLSDNPDAAWPWVREFCECPFDLSAGPPVRVAVVRLDCEESLLAFVTHHVACDGWSLSLVFDDLSAAYGATLRGEMPSLRPPPVQPVDVAVWEASDAVRSHYDAAVAWWVDSVDVGSLQLPLPLDRSTGYDASMRGAVVSRMLPADLTRRLEDLARVEGVTLFATLLVAWSAVLGRRTGADHVPFVVPAAHRDRPELARVVGCFVTMLPLVVDLTGRLTIREALQRARRLITDAFDHRPPSLDAVLAAIRRSNGASLRPPNSIFTLHTVDDARLDLTGAVGTACELEAHSAVADLSLTVSATPVGLELRLRYPTESAPREFFERLLEAFEQSARAGVDRPDAPLRELGALTEAERIALKKCARRDYESSLPPTVREAVEAQARRSPETIAVSSEAVLLTYRGLDRRANGLARRLHTFGARLETVVAVCLPPSPDLVVSALAAMKAGAAYLPIDPAQPVGRLRELLEDLDPVIVIAEPAMVRNLVDSPLRMISINAGDLDEEDGAPVPPAPPNALAYVIFTSGSTGRPKAAAVPQISFRSFVGWLADDYDIRPGEVCSQIVSPSFDASISEVWPCLVSGATLVAAPRGLLADPERLVDWLSDQQVTCAFVPTSVASAIVRLPRYPRRLRILLTGGEAFSAEVPDCVPFELVNQYGPAECSFIASRYRLPPHTAARGLSIGQPTGNVRLHVLDTDLEPVAPGVAGELYIGGLCVGRGYLARPQLTAAAYLPDPFSESIGARVYRTGDVVCWQANGSLRFIGRSDRQVKISGCRVEPAEVEGALMSHPAVGQAAIVAGPTAVGETGLAAHVVPRNGHTVTPEELRAFLEACLPRYMLPSTITLASSFPQLTSGKIDRSKLASPRDARQQQADVTTETETERQLAGIWSAVLGVQVCPADNLFALGATSLQLVRVQLAIQRALGVRLPLAVFFERPTVRSLSGDVDAARSATLHQTPPLLCVDLEAPGPPALAQIAMIALHNTVPDPSVFNVLLTIRFDGVLDESSLDSAIHALSQSHPAFRTSIKTVDGMIRQVPSHKVKPWTRRSRASSATEVRDRALELLMTPFDLNEGSLLRAELSRLPDHAILLLTTHHAFLDGWSTRLLLRDLGALYRARRRGDASTMIPLAVSFAAYARWQRAALESGTFDEDIAYWVEKLRQLHPAVSIVDGSGPRFCLETAHERLPLTHAVMDATRARAASWGVSEYVLNLTVFALSLASFGAEGTVGVAILAENRPRPEIENVVGLFANTLPLALPIKTDLPLEASARRVRSAVIEAQAHQEAPIDAVVQRAAAAGIDPATVQALFLFQDMRSYHVDFGDARASLTDVLGPDAVTLSAWRRPTGFPVALLVEGGADGGALTLLHHPTLVSKRRAVAILQDVRNRLDMLAIKY